jgi:hypothetical protein
MFDVLSPIRPTSAMKNNPINNNNNDSSSIIINNNNNSKLNISPNKFKSPTKMKNPLLLLKNNNKIKNKGTNSSLIKSLNANNNEEEEKENNQKTLKEMIEDTNIAQKTINIINNALELFNTKKVIEEKGNEKYELIERDKYETMKKNNVLFKEQKKNLKEEYIKLKEQYDKVSFDLATHNYNYYMEEKAKTDSITKIYELENELKRMIIENNKIQNEIDKEILQKNNIFRGMNEFKRKYNTSIPKELNEIFDKIKGNEYDPMLKVDNSEKINFLEEKLERLDKLLIEKDKKIEQLKKNIKESKNDI